MNEENIKNQNYLSSYILKGDSCQRDLRAGRHKRKEGEVRNQSVKNYTTKRQKSRV